MSERKSNPIDAHVGSRIRMRRMELGMSQEKLGEQLGLTFQQVQKYEKGINRIGAGRLFDVARALGVPVQWFYDGMAAETNCEVPPDPVAKYLGSREGLELNRAFATITDHKKRRSIVDLVSAMAPRPLNPISEAL